MIQIQVPYDIGSTNDLARICLQQKKFHVANTPGIGPHSCCAVLEATVRGMPRYIFGNSQFKNPIEKDIYTKPWMKCHGEASAVMYALERCHHDLWGNKGDVASLIRQIYIEMSPCEARCRSLLNNINPHLHVYYSFDHPAQVVDWMHAASALCR